MAQFLSKIAHRIQTLLDYAKSWNNVGISLEIVKDIMGACISKPETKGGSNAVVEEIKISNTNTIEQPKKRTKVVADSYNN